MNEYQRFLMDKPSPYDPHCCAVCGSDATNLHHIVLRSQGGSNGPVVRLCGSGTTGCHGLAHERRLHFRVVHETDSYIHWEYLMTDRPMKFEYAIESEGWVPFGFSLELEK